MDDIDTRACNRQALDWVRFWASGLHNLPGLPASMESDAELYRLLLLWKGEFAAKLTEARANENLGWAIDSYMSCVFFNSLGLFALGCIDSIYDIIENFSRLDPRMAALSNLATALILPLPRLYMPAKAGDRIELKRWLSLNLPLLVWDPELRAYRYRIGTTWE